MKSFWDYINDNGGMVEVTVVGKFGRPDIQITVKAMHERDSIRVYSRDGRLIARDEDELCEYFYNNFDIEIRFCDYCGGIMQEGYTDDDGDFHTHVECFPKDMDERYGKGNWREIPDGECNDLGGFYEYRESADSEWEPEPSYYTEWY